MPFQRSTILKLLPAATVGVVLGAATLASAKEGGRPLSVTLTGAAEAPRPGDPDGSGTATLTINPGKQQICFELAASRIAPATAAHIHEAPPGAAGPVVVGLTPPTSGAAKGCASITRERALEILKNPANYYVNIHNSEFPGGALRAQLSK